MQTTIEMLKTLREETGAMIMDCRRALETTDWNYPGALDLLREQAAEKARKRSNREATEGVIELYTHANGRIGVMVEVNTETEFASSSEVFRRFAHEIALQVASSNPLFVSDADLTCGVLSGLAAETAEAARAAGKPQAIIDKIVEGTLEKFKNQNVLLRLPYIRNESITIAQLQQHTVAQIGENIVIRRFLRWEIIPEEK
ncbi:MAG: elongation factor Ts [Anaerolineaceae bacterium]